MRSETEHRITAEEYRALARTRDPERVPVVKDRTCFVWHGHYFELDRFVSPHIGLWLLEVELVDAADDVSLPPWLTVLREVTGDRQYDNATLALTS